MIGQIKFSRVSREQASLEQRSISFNGLVHLDWNYIEKGQRTYRAGQGW